MNYKEVAKEYLLSAIDERIGDLEATIKSINTNPIRANELKDLPGRIKVVKTLEGFRKEIALHLKRMYFNPFTEEEKKKDPTLK